MSRNNLTLLSTRSRSKNRPNRNFQVKKNLVLDLDETLICSQPRETGSLITTPIYFKFKGQVTHYPKVVERPGLDAFLEEMRAHYYLHIFTSSNKEYAEAILAGVGIRKYFSSVWHREHCQIINENYVKDINSLPFLASETILIDDSTLHYEKQPENTLQIKPFYGNEDDNELRRLTPFLIELSKCSDVRSVSEKYSYYCINKTLPASKPISSRLDLERIKFDDVIDEDSEGDLTSIFWKEGDRDILSPNESVSTETSRFSASLTNFKNIRTKKNKPKTPARPFSNSFQFGIEEDVESLWSSRGRRLSCDYDSSLEEETSRFEINLVLRSIRPHQNKKRFLVTEIREQP